jgi:hypothetical protein
MQFSTTDHVMRRRTTRKLLTLVRRTSVFCFRMPQLVNLVRSPIDNEANLYWSTSQAWWAKISFG